LLRSNQSRAGLFGYCEEAGSSYGSLWENKRMAWLVKVGTQRSKHRRSASCAATNPSELQLAEQATH